MELYPDFKELLTLFIGKKIDFLIIGGYALALHGYPRFTGDLDIFINNSRDNVSKIVQALDEFGFGSLGLTAEDFLQRETVIQLGVAPVRVDLLTSLSGLSWNEADSNKVIREMNGLMIPFISKSDLIQNKKASGRLQDLADIEHLQSNDRK